MREDELFTLDPKTGSIAETDLERTKGLLDFERRHLEAACVDDIDRALLRKQIGGRRVLLG